METKQLSVKKYTKDDLLNVIPAASPDYNVVAGSIVKGGTTHYAPFQVPASTSHALMDRLGVNYLRFADIATTWRICMNGFYTF